MLRLTLIAFFVSIIFLLSPTASAQSSDSLSVVHVQTFKLVAPFTGDDGKALSDLIRKQSEIINADPRVVRSYVLRHYWGADSRDLVMITEFKNSRDLFSFYDDLGPMMEKAIPKEEMEAGDALWNKYVGQHSDEIYSQVSGTRK